MSNINYLNRPDTVKVFASQAMDSRYFPVKFGTNHLATKDVGTIANKNFEFGIESLEGDLQPRDLNAVLKYVSSNLAYLFQQGIAEFSPYQDYPANALVQFDGGVWISTKEIQASKHEIELNPCNPCAVPNCEVTKEPSKENGWCKLVSHCTYDNDVTELHAKDTALETAIDNLKGVTGFKIVVNPNNQQPELNLGLSDGTNIIIPMNKFGHITQDNDGELHITNADGSTLELPKYVASQELDQQKGFFWNTKSNKWEVDLKDLVKAGSGLEVGHEGYIKVKPSDIVDGSSISVDGDDKIRLDPKYKFSNFDAPINTLQKKMDDALQTLETEGAKVFTKSPITGTGKSKDPLSLEISNDFVIDSSGKLALNAVAPKRFGTGSSLITNKYQLGFHTFSGNVNANAHTGMLGLPVDVRSQSKEQDKALEWDQYASDQEYDFNGYYIASSGEVSIWLANNQDHWYISNDSGVHPDGTLKNPNDWTKWQKLDNAGGVTDQMVTRLQEQINSLGNQVQAGNQKAHEQADEIAALKAKNAAQDQEINVLKAKQAETCKVPCKHVDSNYTIQDTDNTLICTNTKPITITLDPKTVPQGRVFTVVQSSTGKISFTSTIPNKLIAPLDGSLTMAGTNAVVSVLFEINQYVRIFGQTE